MVSRTINKALPLSGIIQNAVKQSEYCEKVNEVSIRRRIIQFDAAYGIFERAQDYLRKIIKALEPIARDVQGANIGQLQWISEGYQQLSIISYNLEVFADASDLVSELKQEKHDHQETRILNTLPKIAEQVNRARKCTEVLINTSSIAMQYKEINHSIMESINKEIEESLKDVSKLNTRYTKCQFDDVSICFHDLVSATDKLPQYGNGRYSRGLHIPLLDKETRLLTEDFACLCFKAEPISASITYIPQQLESFNRLSGKAYPSCTIELIRKYQGLVKMYINLDDQISSLWDRLIGARWQHIFQGLLDEANNLLTRMENTVIVEGSKMRYVNSILEYLSKILQGGFVKDKALGEKYDSLVARVAGKEVNNRDDGRDDSELSASPNSSTRDKGNVENASSKRLSEFKGQNFIRSLDIKPVMISGPPISVRRPCSSKDLVNSLGANEKAKLKIDSKKVIARLMGELQLPPEDGTNKENMGPTSVASRVRKYEDKSVSTPLRSIRLPETPNPFVTPSIKNKPRKSRLPRRTPSDKKTTKSMIRSSSQITPINERPKKKASLSHGLNEFDVLPEEADISRKSRIPLPLRPESRISIRKSTLGNSTTGDRRIHSMGSYDRPSSRLEKLGTKLSSKNGTPSPVIGTKRLHSFSVARPRTALCNDLDTRQKSPPTYNLLDTSHLKVRAKTSLRGSNMQGANSNIRTVSCDQLYY
ncbi:hypothetical protein HII12_003532 [Brettanomyces bruxellensis]|uniref:DEBR0S2_10704g1_1 n=1 Tax=Dekkera bruxellensis TaxID=5007 RepID=A0A7D9CWP8_DEKBR|nr:hypothetical protein HII12_003532 [Brettanomyces bruxellensis]VUG17571.1 DEBR0S2_10704g1_1 [Brettanomyces bruxellensis]